LQRGERILALGGDDQVAMVVIGLDLKGHQLSVRREHGVDGEQILSDTTGLDVADLHGLGA
jgi:hypothetical protein